MTLEIRPIRDDELERAEGVIAYAFNSADRANLAEAVERSRGFYPADWSLAAFDAGELRAFLRVLPFAIRMNGRGLPFGGVSFVATLPQHRRRGYVGALLRRSLEDMRERGQSLSGLYTPHPALYRRFGWEIASNWRSVVFAPKDITLRAKRREQGSARLLGPDDWSQLDRVYRAYGRDRTGLLHRPEVWWREGVFGGLGPFGRQQHDALLWSDDSGEPQGYAVYAQATHPNPEDGTLLSVRELVALTGDAYVNLVQLLLRHDLARQLHWAAPPDDPFVSLVEDASRLKVEEHYGLLLRIVDLPAALAARPPGAERVEPFTIAVSDPAAPWNGGVWRIEAAEGQASVERVDAAPDLSLAVTTLASLYDGYLAPSPAALAGLVDVHRPEALAAAGRFFATRYPPYCGDVF